MHNVRVDNLLKQKGEGSCPFIRSIQKIKKTFALAHHFPVSYIVCLNEVAQFDSKANRQNVAKVNSWHIKLLRGEGRFSDQKRWLALSFPKRLVIVLS